LFSRPDFICGGAIAVVLNVGLFELFSWSFSGS
jgi:hypothetical protein